MAHMDLVTHEIAGSRASRSGQRRKRENLVHTTIPYQ